MGRDARPVPRLGLDLPGDLDRGRDAPAVPHGRRPVLAGGSDPAGMVDRPGRPLLRRAQPARMARQRHRRCAPARRRDGDGRVRGTDDPIGHHGAAHRHHARLGRDLRSGLPRRAPAAHRDLQHRARVRRGGDPRRPIGLRRGGRARSARPGGRPHLAHRLVDRLPVRIAPGDAAQPAARRDRDPDGPRRPRPRPDGHADRGARLGGSRLDHARIGPRRAVPAGDGQPGRVHRLRLDAAGRTAAARRDLRLRQSRGRGHPRRDHPQRADRPAHDRRGRDHRDLGGGHRHRAESHAGGPAAVGRPHDLRAARPVTPVPAATAAPTR